MAQKSSLRSLGHILCAADAVAQSSTVPQQQAECIL